MAYGRIGGPGKVSLRQLLLLHAGYNMKADQGPERCLQKQRLNASELHVVHFSGKEKPFWDQRGKDASWRRARERFASAFDAVGRRIGIQARDLKWLKEA